jgi:calcium/calmodulin-dependent protein kinase I
MNIFHRDLKPENILFREKDNLDSICITDFGLADFYNPEGNYIFTRCGSPGFVAPEVLHD